MGAPLPANSKGMMQPTALKAVLVHWGGVDVSAAHRGVILEQREWTKLFRDLFTTIRGYAKIPASKTLDEFDKEYPHYASTRRQT